MKRELTTEQINHLYRYLADKGIEYFDVQVELVDHIASKIEEQLDLYPEKPTHEVFEQTLKKFNERGFEQVVKEKEKQVARQYRRYGWESFKDFFSWPKIVFTAVLTGVVYVFLSNSSIEVFKAINESVLLICVTLGIGYSITVGFRNVMMPQKLSFTNYGGVGTGLIIINFNYVVKLILKYMMLGETTYPLGGAFLLSLSFLLGIAKIQAYEKLRAYSRQLYPKAFKSVPKLV